jgi:hypothetical protein
MKVAEYRHALTVGGIALVWLSGCGGGATGRFTALASALPHWAPQVALTLPLTHSAKSPAGETAAGIDSNGRFVVWNVRSKRQILSAISRISEDDERQLYDQPRLWISRDGRFVGLVLKAGAIETTDLDKRSRRLWEARAITPNDKESLADLAKRAARELGTTWAHQDPAHPATLNNGVIEPIQTFASSPLSDVFLVSSASGAWWWTPADRDVPDQPVAFRGAKHVVPTDRHVAVQNGDGWFLYDLLDGSSRRLRSLVTNSIFDISEDGQSLIYGPETGGLAIFDVTRGGPGLALAWWPPRLAHDLAKKGWFSGGMQVPQFGGAGLSRDGKLAMSIETGPAVEVFRTDDGARVARFDVPGDRHCAGLVGPKSLFVVGATRWGRVFDLESGRIVTVADAPAAPQAQCWMSSGGTALVGTAITRPDGKMVQLQKADTAPESAAFNNDASQVVVSSRESLRGWRVSDGALLMDYSPPPGAVVELRFIGKDHFAALGADGGVRIYHRLQRAPQSTLFASKGSWLVVDREGRLDTNDLESVPGLAYTLEGSPREALSADLFLRSYYQPGLLRKLWQRDRLQPVEAVASLDLERPTVEFVSVEREGERASVRVRVRPPAAAKPGSSHNAFQLRLFRDGQLVADFPKTPDDIPSGPSKLAAWRKAMPIPIDASAGYVDLPPFNVALGRFGASAESPLTVELSAYAFNGSRVRGDVTKYQLDTPAGAISRAGRVFLLTIAVGRSNDASLTLTLVADGARELRDRLKAALEAGPNAKTVVPVSLISDPISAPRADELTPSGANITTVLQTLGGTHPSSAPDGELTKAGPQDAVIIYVAAHGERAKASGDKLGDFGFLPADPERGAITARALTSLLRAIDAGSITLVLDTCYAGASLRGTSFLPGPLGNPGLAQLAYDKQMQVLAATQAADVALSGVLSSALSAALDEQGTKSLGEVLRAAERRVRNLTSSAGTGQIPELFDYARTVMQPVLASKGPR